MENKKIILALYIAFMSCNTYKEAYTNSGNKHELHKTSKPDTCKPRNLTYVTIRL